MSEQLFLRFGDIPDRVTLAVLNADGQLLGRPEETTLTAAAARSAGSPLTVLLPAREIVSCVAVLPAVSASRLRQMLPYSLEDEFAGDVEELHFAAGDRNEAGAVEVSVIARERIDYWLGVLNAAGIVARRICSEADGVADTPGVTTLYVENRKILGRRPGGPPFAFEEFSLPELWRMLEAEREDTADLQDVVIFADSETLRERSAEIDAWREGVANVNLKELAHGSLPRLAAALVFREAPNLLQGSYALRSNYSVLLRPWRAAAVLMLCVIGFAILGRAGEAWKLKQDDELLRAEIDSLCNAGYAARDERACRLELQRRLAGSGQSTAGGQGFLQTLATVAGAGGDAIRIDQLNFSDDVMRLNVIVPSVSYLETFNEGVSGDGSFDVQVRSNSAVEGGFEAQLLIVGAAP